MPVKSGRENFAGPMKLSVSWLHYSAGKLSCSPFIYSFSKS